MTTRHLNVIVVLIFLTVQGCSTVSPQAFKGLNDSVGQVVFVHPARQGSSRATLSAWQKEGAGNKDWHRVFSVSAVIGRNGLAAPQAKKEGDGKTPSGIYALGPAFGYAPSINTGLEYRQVTDNDFWVDDTQSMQYNQWIAGVPDARSFERLKRKDNLYQYAMVIRYNTDPVIKGAGSAIFMHVWRRYNAPTAGCVALSQRNIRKILRWLNKASQPTIMLE